jgi:hypothetical protein
MGNSLKSCIACETLPGSVYTLTIMTKLIPAYRMLIQVFNAHLPDIPRHLNTGRYSGEISARAGLDNSPIRGM